MNILRLKTGIKFQSPVNHFNQLAGSFHSGKTATVYDESQQATFQLRVLGNVCMLEVLNNMVAQLICIGQVAHAKTVLLKTRGVGQIGLLANSKHKVVVFDTQWNAFTALQIVNLILGAIHADNLGHPDLNAG